MLTSRNEAGYLRTRLIETIAQAAFEGTLMEKIDRIPLELRPRSGDSSRCCVYKDRAVIRYRIMALLGHAVEEETDELRPLADYCLESLSERRRPSPSLTVLDIACSSCRDGGHIVTDLCRGCVARPCMTNCPKKAITIIDGRARINREACVDCGKCRQVCPFEAIAFRTVPCETACPVGAIAKDDSGKAVIDENACIHCGRCSRSCPFAAIMERSSILPVIELLKDGNAVAMIAPSIAGQFPGTVNQSVTALKLLGFSKVAEVAAGAEKTTEREALEFAERRSGGSAIMGTSCCPAYVRAVKLHAPEFAPLVSETPTPLTFTGREAAERFPGAPRVFIGPCFAKKAEVLETGAAEYVITFEELGALFLARDIDVRELEESLPDLRAGDGQAWGYASSGGVAENVARYIGGSGKNLTCPTVSVDGLDRKALNRLKAAAAGNGPEGLWEVMACEGGCICGPGTVGHPKIALKALEKKISEGLTEEARAS